MKWIKASERLPGKGEIKFSRINGHLKCCIQLSVRTNKIHIAGDLIPTHYALNQIEWLDESEDNASIEDASVEQRAKELYPYPENDLYKEGDPDLQEMIWHVDQLRAAFLAGHSSGEQEAEGKVLVALADLVSDLEQHYRAQKLLVSTHEKIRQAKIILSDTSINS